MDVNIPEQARGILYVLTGLGSIVATYLGASGTIGADEMAAWTAFTVFVAGLARFNLGNSPKDGN